MGKTLHPAQLLEARDAGACLHLVDRALLMLGLAGGSNDPASLPIAARDHALFEMHRANFGDVIACLVDCPECGAVLEFDLSAKTLIEQSSPAPGPETININGWQVSLRPLDSRDMAVAALSETRNEAVALLTQRAIANSLPPDGTDDEAPLPAIVSATIARRVNEREDANVALELTCSECGHGWTAPVEPAAHLWSAVERRANRLVTDVAALASRFGWSEAAILALPPARLRAYLEVVGAA
jgi:hypothetical protein